MQDVRAKAIFNVANCQIASLETFALLFTLVFNVPGSLALFAWQCGWSKTPNTGPCEDHAITQLLTLGPQIYHASDWAYAKNVFETREGAFFADGPRTAWQNHEIKKALASQGLVVFPCMRSGCDKPAADGLPSIVGSGDQKEDLHFCGNACKDAYLQESKRARRQN